MSFRLNSPPRVTQSSNMSCWAAAFRSWARANGITISDNLATDADITSLLQGSSGNLFPNGSATDRGISTISHLGFMRIRRLRGAGLTEKFFYNTLRNEGYIYLAFSPGFTSASAGGHVVVVFGVEDGHVLAMDPDHTISFPSRVPVDSFISRHHGIVGTSILGPPMNIGNPFSGLNQP